MSYVRYKNENPLSPEEKAVLLRDYIEFYTQIAQTGDPKKLNSKIPRAVFDEIIDFVGSTLVAESKRMTRESPEVRLFLDENPLPAGMESLLPDDFRVFTLMLNAMKQWVVAEAAACDRYLLGGTAKAACRQLASHCMITGEPLDANTELHHPVRDGRPPIPLSKHGHELIENQIAVGRENVNSDADDLWLHLKELRGRNRSWTQLREGCMAILTGSMTCRPAAKSFANKVIREVGLNPEEIIKILDEHGV